MTTVLAMAAALVMLAAVVVAKIITMEMLAAHHRRYQRQLDRLESARGELRAASNRHVIAEREWRRAEHRRHRVHLRLAHAREQIDARERDDARREAHFDLITAHLVER